MLIDELDEEDQRAAHEGLEEPKLTIFDLLCKEAQLFEKERTEVKILASHGKLIDFIENSKLKISDINHLYPACTWVDKSDYYKKIILFFKHKYFTEIIFGYHEIGPFRLKEPYKRLFFSVIQTVTKKRKPINKEIIDSDSSSLMEYQYELLDAYRYDGKNSYDFVNNISIEVDFDNPLTNSELEFFMQTIRKDIILAQHKNRTHGLICAESLSDYERAGDIDALEGITLDDYTKNTTKIINLKNINGIVSYIAALILIKSRRDHVDSKNTKNKLEDDIFEVAEKLRDFVGNPNNFHPLGGFKEKNEGHHDNKKISNDGLGDSTIKAKRADVLKATEKFAN